MDVRVNVDAEQVWLEVKDNGGVCQELRQSVRFRTGVGLAGMRERVPSWVAHTMIKSDWTL